ncbi:MAG: MFS transporter [bacterium]|nr:MFS transporter [bacterium]
MWRRNVYIYHLWSFFNAFWIAAAILVPFFKENGLSQFEIQSLQALFQVSIFLLEIPTGAVADKWGRRVSLALGGALTVVGFIIYSQVHSFWWFALGEFILAIAMALKSGSDQAIVYDSLKQAKQTRWFGQIISRNRIITLVAIMLGANIGSWLTNFISLSQIFLINGLLISISIVASLKFQETTIQNSSEVKRWHHILFDGWKLVKNSLSLRFLMIEGAMLYGLGYFIIWLYPVKLASLNISLQYYGLFHATFHLDYCPGYLDDGLAKNYRPSRDQKLSNPKLSGHRLRLRNHCPDQLVAWHHFLVCHKRRLWLDRAGNYLGFCSKTYSIPSESHGFKLFWHGQGHFNRGYESVCWLIGR